MFGFLKMLMNKYDEKSRFKDEEWACNNLYADYMFNFEATIVGCVHDVRNPSITIQVNGDKYGDGRFYFNLHPLKLDDLIAIGAVKKQIYEKLNMGDIVEVMRDDGVIQTGKVVESIEELGKNLIRIETDFENKCGVTALYNRKHLKILRRKT